MKRKDFIVTIDGKETMLSFKTPSSENIEEADRIYASKMSSLIREGGKKRLLLRQEVDKFLKESGIWSTEDDAKLQLLSQEVEDLLGKLRKGGIKLSEGKQIAIQIRDKRIETFVLLRKRQILDNATIEANSDNEKADYLIFCCTVYAESGENYWESFEDMKNDKNSEVYDKSANIAIELIYNISPDFEKEFPENKWLKKYNFIDGELNYIDRKTGEKVDRNGNPLKTEIAELVLAGSIEESEQPFIED